METVSCSNLDSQSQPWNKLRGCDIVGLKLVDVAPHGYAADRASVRQRKTGRPVRFEMTEQTRQAIDDYRSQRGGTGSIPLPGTRFRRAFNHATVRKTLGGLARNDWP
jgi:hypothetical protein